MERGKTLNPAIYLRARGVLLERPFISSSDELSPLQAR